MKIYVYNPANGAPIKNWYDGTNRWSIAVDEVKGFAPHVAKMLLDIFGFLQEVSEAEAESKLAQLSEDNVPVVKASPEGVLVPKSEEEISADKAEVAVKKTRVRKVLDKVKKAKDAEPEDPAYEDLSRGDLIALCHQRKIEIKGIGGKNQVTKETIIQLLENDDAQK